MAQAARLMLPALSHSKQGLLCLKLPGGTGPRFSADSRLSRLSELEVMACFRVSSILAEVQARGCSAGRGRRSRQKSRTDSWGGNLLNSPA